MQDLKRIAAIGGAVVLVACWPLAVGQIAQNVLTDAVKNLNSNDYSATLVSYDRSYLSASAETEYSVVNPVVREQLIRDGLPTEFRVKHEIQHGLMRIAAESHLIDMDEVPLTLSTTTQLNGNTDFELALEKLNYQPESSPGSALYIGNSKVEGSATVLGEVDLSFRFPSTQFKFSNGENLSFSNVTGHARGKKINQFWHGEQSLQIDTISVMTNHGVTLAGGKSINYQFNSKADETGERINTHHQLTTGELQTDSGKVDKLTLDFSVGDLHSQSFEQLVTIYQDNPVITEQVFAQSTPYIDSLFEQGFYLSMDNMKMELAGGYFDTHWKLTVPQGSSNISQDFSRIISILQGDVDSFVSEGLVEAYPFIRPGIDNMVAMQYMTKEEQGYKLDAEIGNGELTFSSGEKLPLLSLLLSSMAQ